MIHHNLSVHLYNSIMNIIPFKNLISLNFAFIIDISTRKNKEINKAINHSNLTSQGIG